MRLSRHARNNLRLYGIEKREIEEVIQMPEHTEQEGRQHIAYKTFPERFGDKPLKVIYVIEDEVIVITAYPLRKAYRR